jgi:cation transport ATPase
LGRLGIVARSGDFLEALAAVDVALFDKTGTLCEPDLGIAHFRVHAASPLEAVRLRAALAAAERGVAHPVAAALRAHGEGPGTGGWETVEARVVSGRGLRARVRAAGDGRMRTILAGSAALLAEAGVRMEEGEGGSEAGRVRVCVAVDGVHAATIDLDESPRARADALFDELMRLGLRVEILTGDPDFSPRLWPAVRREAGLKPEDKAERVRALQRTGARVLFVGDGINDAAALAVADASLAVRQGSDLARAHAQAVVAGEGLGTVPDAVRLARAVRSTIRGSLVFSVIYNACGMLVAAAGWLHPVVAALAMAGSSVFVASRSLRFGSFSEKQR